jgi:hypothetical protein
MECSPNCTTACYSVEGVIGVASMFPVEIESNDID